ncbi:hypothetical protein ETAA8_25400 [Anatilimnocola aggregata]|uniref:DNA mimic protein DMP19 C-terminal domain-containing protein n=1 Tax=Anatilimnocola aggregata TaxID=2528021 RepID=A0A517YBE8_9BACT|nr:DUF4375 domain-containing protein [Anatilimnocola aggregata]QDU27452.1 hypothetical protein ETAA8_25400 [Anatilimnocola aggregata]
MNDQESLLEHASTIAFEKLKVAGGEISLLDEPFRTVALVFSAQGVIDNGGLNYFFESDWPGNPSYSLFADAYRRIGSVDAANAIQDAATSFGISFPERDSKLRNEFMEKQFGADGAWEVQWDDAVCGDERVWSNLEKWIRSNTGNTFK